MILFNPFFLLVLAICIFVAIRVLLYRTGLVFIVKKWWRAVEDCFHVYQSFKVPEFNESMQENQLYTKVTDYLNSLTSIEDSDFANLVTGKKPNEIVLQLDPNQSIADDFLGAKVVWRSEVVGRSHRRNLVLRIRRADKRRILRPYLQHIHVVADELDQRRRDLRLYMNVRDTVAAADDVGTDDFRHARWRAVPFTHPATLETIAMEADLKSKIKSDLESFLKAKQYYNRLGRVWRRSFLLYGPSGTGKSSFVAAMANFLGYDVYDLDLSLVKHDSELNTLLLQTTARSVIVIEDLDRFFESKSTTAVSFSGISNFMDGLLNSCCAEERVMVFTMNSKDHVDPNFLRPGRIDVHIHFPLCDFAAFRNLATSYLGVKEHKLFPQVEEIFQSGSSLSPAEIGELMIANRNSPSRAIKSVITALQTDGEGRGAAAAAAAGKLGRPLRGFETGSRKSGDESEPGVAFCGGGVNTVREFRKLYGFLRMRGSKNSQSFDAGSERSVG